MVNPFRFFLLGVACVSATVFSFPLFVGAQAVSGNQGDIKSEIDALQSQAKEKESQIKDLEAMIGKYKAKIAAQEAAASTLQNQVALLENRITEKQLSVQEIKNRIELTNLQIQTLGRRIEQEIATLARREASLGELILRIHQASGVSVLDALLTRPSLSEFFSRLDQLKSVERDLEDATRFVRASKAKSEENHKRLLQEQATLEKQKQQLQNEQKALERDRSAKTSLIAETQNREEEYQRVLYELRQEQQTAASRAADIQDRLKEKLNSIDESLARGDVLLNWPIPVLKGVSAYFHDPSYPFRKLFEHPGIDFPTAVGTPVRASAGGYVAWNKTGKQYGNYVMLVHPGGIATVYAHLSKFGVKADTYVERGEIIGYSGGRPGDQGAGLSTGPHLHFEVRQNGIPVNPENFLPNLE